jgi:hypothetical protein
MAFDQIRIEQLKRLKTALKKEFGEYPGVEGFGIGDNCLRVYIHDITVSNGLPKEVEGIDIAYIVTGEIRPLNAAASNPTVGNDLCEKPNSFMPTRTDGLNERLAE